MDYGIVSRILVGETDPGAQLADQQRYARKGEFGVILFPELREDVPFVYRAVLPGHGMAEVLEIVRLEYSGFEH